MTDSNEQFWEWEPLESPLEVSSIDPALFNVTPERMKISRDSEYRLEAFADGFGAELQRDVQRTLNLRAGELYPNFSLMGKSGGNIVTVFQPILPSQTIRADGYFELRGQITRLEAWSKERPLSGIQVVDYGIGLDINTIFTRSTHRNFTDKIEFLREIPESNYPSIWSFTGGEQAESFSYDYIFLKGRFGEVSVARTLKSVGERHPYSFMIQHQPDQTDEFRKSILEGLSFVFGKRLTLLGRRFFSEGIILGFEALSPSTITNDRNVLARPPIELSANGFLNESIVQNLVDAYIDNQARFALRDVISNVWLARRIPLGSNLVVYWAALERLADAWFDKTGTGRPAEHVADEEFQARIKPIIELADQQLPNSIPWLKIRSKLSRVNNVGAAEKIREFFDGIALPIGKVEQDAIKARNVFAHGRLPDSSRAGKVMHATWAYEAILSRAILRLLSFDGNYVDYSTIGLPIRPIEAPLGGDALDA